jgi:hypothetical protein
LFTNAFHSVSWIVEIIHDCQHRVGRAHAFGGGRALGREWHPATGAPGATAGTSIPDISAVNEAVAEPAAVGRWRRTRWEKRDAMTAQVTADNPLQLAFHDGWLRFPGSSPR